MAADVKTVFSATAPWAVILLLVCLALFAHPGNVGKTVVPPAISSLDRFYGVAAGDSNNLWLVGDFGKIVHSTDGGADWTIQHMGDDINLQAVAAWNATDAVVVGDRSKVLVTRDGGKTWQAPPSLPFKHQVKLLNVRTAANGVAWAVGEHGVIMRTGDMGATWHLMRGQQDVGLQGVAAVGSEDVWVVGEFGTILHSSDGGTTWTQQTSGTQSYLNAVAFRDPSNGVAVGLDGALLVTADGGQAWSAMETPKTNHYFAVAWNGSSWIVTGDDGVVVSSGGAGQPWRSSRLGDGDFSWHTAVVATSRGWLLAGSSVGLYSSGADWRPIVTQRKG